MKLALLNSVVIPRWVLGGALAAYAAGGYTPNLMLDGPGGVYADPAGNSAIHTISESARDNPATMFSDGVLKWSAHNFLPYSEDLTEWSASGTPVVTETSVEDVRTDSNSYIESTNNIPGNGLQKALFFAVEKDAVATSSRFPMVRLNGNSSYDICIDTTDGSYGQPNTAFDDVSVETDGTYFYFTCKFTDPDNAPDVRIYPALGAVADITTVTTGDFNSATTGAVGITRLSCYRSDLGGMVANPEAEAWQTGDAVYYVPTTTAARYLTRWGAEVYAGSEFVRSVGLFEPQATNLEEYSNDFTTGWYIPGANSATLTANSATGPDGNTSLTKIEKTDTTNEIVGIAHTKTFSVATNYVLSTVVSNGDCDFASLWVLGGTNHWVTVTFDLTTGTVSQESTGSSSGTVADSGVVDLGSGLYRIWMVAQVGSVGGTEQYGVFLNSTGTPTLGATGLESWAGSGGEYINAGFVDFVQGSTLSSHIPTNGSTVTRTPDTNGLIIPYESLDLGGVMPDAVSWAAEGYVSYGSTTAGNLDLFNWEQDGNDYIRGIFIDNNGKFDGSANHGGTLGSVNVVAISQGVNQAFSVAQRVTEAETNIAVNGTAQTADTYSATMTPLQDDNINIATGPGPFFITKVRIWLGDDIGDAGLEEATA